MQADLAAQFPVVQTTYAEASAALGYDLWQLVQGGPADKLGETVVTQPAMLTAGVAAYRAWRDAGGDQPSQVAGHSLGEYTALVVAGVVSFEGAMRIVMRRAQLMQDAVPVGVGAMAAILGLDNDAVRAVCAEASGTEVAEPVNYNSPGQVVIAGHVAAVDDAIERAKAAGARRAMKLPVSVPSHSSLMTEAGKTLGETLAKADFSKGNIPILAATDGTLYGDAEDIRSRLSRQVYSHVHWVATIKAMIADGGTRIIECGPGKVLAGLIRRIDKGTPVSVIDNHDSLQKALQD